MDDNEKLKLVQHWNSLKGDEILRLDYPLRKSSIVFDVGSYKGDWAAKILERYGCTVWAFEPMPPLAIRLFDRFHNFKQGHTFVMNYGLDQENHFQRMFYDGDHPDSSSMFGHGSVSFEALFRDVVQVVDEVDGGHVDLIKINTEGSEYNILNRILHVGYAKRFTDIQVQFHDFIEGSNAMRESIREKLFETHDETYCVPFVWENWRLK